MASSQSESTQNDDNVLAVCEIAGKLNVSEQVIYREIKNRKLKAKKVGGQWRILQQWLNDYLNINKN